MIPVRTLTIAIPSRNRPDDIQKCVASIAAQHTPPNQLIVMDQSTEKYNLPTLPYLEHIHDTSVKGLPAARNRCIKALKSDAVLFLDDDCELLSDCVPGVCASFNAHENAIALQCVITQPVFPGWRLQAMNALFRRGFFNERQVKRANGIQVRTLAGCAMAFRSSLFNDELFDEKLNDYAIGEDWDFAKRAQRYGTMWIAETARVHHHHAPVNRYKSDRLLNDRWSNFLYFYDKYDAGADIRNQAWLVWWMIGESLRALRMGVKPPIFNNTLKSGAKSKNKRLS